MKRYFLIALVLILSLCGCQYPAQTTNIAKSAEQTGVDAQHTSSAGSVKHITSYGEYEDFLKNTDIPYEVVHYDKLQHFGAFENFYIRVDFEAEDTSKFYIYNFLDDAGVTIDLEVSDVMINFQTLTKLSGNDINFSNMRYAKSGGYFEIYGLVYQYHDDGRLKQIVWRDSDTQYCLSSLQGISKMTSEYPEGTDTVLSSLLNLENKNAVDVWSIISGVNISFLLCLLGTAVCICIAGSAAVFLIIRKKKKQATS